MFKVNKLPKFTFYLITLFSLAVLALCVRGNPGNPTQLDLDTPYWKEEGPFELSPERGRFILTYSILENGSFQFSEALARFGAPDVAVTNQGKFASLFAPALSFITMPGFLIGKYLGISQVGTFFIICVFAILNFLLIVKIATKLGANIWASTAGGLTFLFATPSFAYSVSLYQHQVSTTLILLSVYFLINFRGFKSLFLIFLLSSLALTLDYPNLFLMFPIGLIALFKIFSIQKIKDKVRIVIKLPLLLSLVGLIFPMLFFLWFNNASYGSPFQLSGTLGAIRDLDEGRIRINNSINGAQPKLEQIKGKQKNAVGFFKTRNLTNGLYIHFLSPDRGIIFYTPVMFFAIAGIVISYRKKIKLTALLLAIVGSCILLYSMWADPWGGWAFGSRYLIPAYAVLAIFIAIFLSRFSKNLIAIALFLLVFSYSAYVNTAGALSSSANPPQVEVLALEKLSGREEKYTFQRNIDYLKYQGSKSFFFRSYAHNFIKSYGYFYLIFSTITIISTMVVILNAYHKGGHKVNV